MVRMRTLLAILTGLSILSAASPPASAQAADRPTVSNDLISAAIGKSVEWIYRQQNQWGTWESGQEPAGVQRDRADQGQFGERTALAVQALLAAGESDRDPRLQRAVDFLIVNQRIVGTFAVGLRAQVWPMLTSTPAIRQMMVRDRNTLLAAIHARGATRGLFSFRTDYENEPDYADHDVSFHAALGVRALADAGIEIPDSFWRSMQRAWRSQQNRDGSWAYRLRTSASADMPNRLDMTANGVAVLLAIDDELAASLPADCRPVPLDRYIDLGLGWIDQHFDHLRDPFDFGGFTLLNYGLYSIARIGQISGRAFFNQRDWYQEGARVLLDSQDQSGAWASLPDTCFGLIFLSRGRSPVIVSKLQYTAAPPAPEDRPSRYGGRMANPDLRPRDIANFSAWLGRACEQSFNWETVSLAVDADELHDSSILYIAGNQAMNLSPEEKAKLKQFVEQGGMLVGNADCGAKAFSDAFRKLGLELFPDYEFRNIPRDSVIFTHEQYRASRWRLQPQLLELTNGVRDLMILIPSDDPSRYFQQRQVGGRQYLYELMADIVFYSVDQNGARLRGDSFLVRPDPGAVISRQVKLARLSYNGNWNPEPGGWPRLSAILRNTRGIDLHVSAIRPGEGNLNRSFAVAHLTGTTVFQLDEAARAEIRRYVQRGGVLAVDAAGGAAAFDAAAQNQLKIIFPEALFDVAPPDYPVFSAGQPLVHAAYRRYARSRLPDSDRFRLQFARLGSGIIFYSPEDISAGLVGEAIDGIYGYQPRTAAELMGNIISFAAGH
jgi:uncharacterized protein DUF4159/squalene-hopene cyclase-like protein